MDSRICQIIFANLINEFMIHKPDLIHSASLSAVSPRKIWLAYENDIVITPIPIEEGFKEYACSITGVEPVNLRYR